MSSPSTQSTPPTGKKVSTPRSRSPRSSGGTSKRTPRGSSAGSSGSNPLGSSANSKQGAAPSARSSTGGFAAPASGSAAKSNASSGAAAKSSKSSTAAVPAKGDAIASKIAADEAEAAADEQRKVAAAAENAMAAVQAAAAEADKIAERSIEIGSQLKTALAASSTRMIDLFRDWDEDQNGVVDKGEFHAALTSMGMPGTKEEHDALFEMWDADNSGGVDFKEMSGALKRLEVARKASAVDIQRLIRGANVRRAATSAGADGDAAPGGDAPDRSRSAAAEAERMRMAREKAQAKKAQMNAPQLSKAKSLFKKRKEALEEEEESHEWTVAQWLRSLSLHEVFVSALSDLPPPGKSQFTYVRGLTRERLTEMLMKSDLVPDIIDLLMEGVEKLSAGPSVQDGAVRSDKFQTNAKFQMSYGSLSLFYGGLESLLGPPKMVRGSLYDAMAGEHTNEVDSKIDFATSNGVTTTSEVEWEAVHSPVSGKQYPERHGFQKQHPECCRVVKTVPQMLQTMEVECNEKLRKAGHSELIVEELVGGRMYTGPCYAKYNAVLRAKSKDSYLVQTVKELCLGNEYVTTIHAINSCVLKLSKLTKAGKVWRGIRDAKLPKTFWVANSMGVRGGIEYGFSSTSTDKTQALAYAGASSMEAGDASTIFEMQMGMVDRGADLQWLSQYPHEKEVLLPPLTGLEALSHSVEGGMLVIQSRLSLNMAAHTLEQVLSRRRKMLMDMCTGIELEIRDAVDIKLGQLAVDILQRALLFGPLSKDTEWFNDDENFAQVMASTLRLQHALLSELPKLSTHMEKSELNLKGWKEKANSRMFMIAGWVLARSSANDVAVDLRESNVQEDEALILADMLQKIPKLTSIDVRGNPGLGEKGVAALAQALRDEKPGHPRSLCGVSPGNTRLDVPRSFAPEQDTDMAIIVAELENHVYAESVTAGMGGKGSSAGFIQLNRRGGGGTGAGWQPLIWAARVDHVQVAQKLLSNGAKVNEQEAAGSHSQKYSPLHMACYKGHTEMVRLLLRSGADPSLKDVNGNLARMQAEKKGFAAIVKLLDLHREGGIEAVPIAPAPGETEQASASGAAAARGTPRAAPSSTPRASNITPRAAASASPMDSPGGNDASQTTQRGRRGAPVPELQGPKRPAFGANKTNVTPRAGTDVNGELAALGLEGTPRAGGTPRASPGPQRPGTPSMGGMRAVE